jgi:hypothetical protein
MLFNADNRNELDDKVEDFFKGEGEDIYRRFLKAMNQLSKVAVSDGNPNSTTALMARSIFEEVGFGGDDYIDEALQTTTSAGQGVGLGLMTTLGQFRAGGFDGDYYALPLSFKYKINEQVRVKINAPLSYLKVEDSDVYNVGLLVSVPYKVLDKNQAVAGSPLSRLDWEVTPTLGVAAGGSDDYAAGSVMYVAAVTSRLSYDIRDYTLTMGNHISFLEGQNTDIDGFEVGGEVSQRILKNGLKFSAPFDGKWVGEIYGIYTNFLDDAAVEDFFTVGAQAGLKLYENSSTGGSGFARFGVLGDFGDDYDNYNISIGTGFRF